MGHRTRPTSPLALKLRNEFEQGSNAESAAQLCGAVEVASLVHDQSSEQGKGPIRERAETVQHRLVAGGIKLEHGSEARTPPLVGIHAGGSADCTLGDPRTGNRVTRIVTLFRHRQHRLEKQREHRYSMLPRECCKLDAPYYLLQWSCSDRAGSGQRSGRSEANHRIGERAERANAGLARSQRISAHCVAGIRNTIDSGSRDVGVQKTALGRRVLSQYVVQQTGIGQYRCRARACVGGIAQGLKGGRISL